MSHLAIRFFPLQTGSWPVGRVSLELLPIIWLRRSSHGPAARQLVARCARASGRCYFAAARPMDVEAVRTVSRVPVPGHPGRSNG